jgi:DNA-binding transcriptional ArsR family regulator
VQAVLKALAEPRRVAILKLVAGREMPAGEIARRFKTSRPAISQHLRVLTDAGLLAQRRVGTLRLYRARPETMAELRGFLDGFWDDGLAALKREAETEARSKGRPRGRR